jgi:hypothetical protein
VPLNQFLHFLKLFLALKTNSKKTYPFPPGPSLWARPAPTRTPSRPRARRSPSGAGSSARRPPPSRRACLGRLGPRAYKGRLPARPHALSPSRARPRPRRAPPPHAGARTEPRRPQRSPALTSEIRPTQDFSAAGEHPHAHPSIPSTSHINQLKL